MRRRQVAALLLLVLLPLGLLTWLGVRGESARRALARERIGGLGSLRTEHVESQIAGLLDRRARHLLGEVDPASLDGARLRALMRSSPDVDAVFVQREDGALEFPSRRQGLSSGEAALLLRVRRILLQRELWHAEPAELEAKGSSLGDRSYGFVQQSVAQSASTDVDGSFGWYSWYWETGLHLLFWVRDGDRRIAALEISRERLIADIVTEVLAEPWRDGELLLHDSRGRVLHRWGAELGADDAGLHQERALGAPLSGWRLAYRHRSLRGSGDSIFLLVAGLLVVGAALTGLSVYLYRESLREQRDASQKVAFVSQVSHELRSPLTNIRMYAELMSEEEPSGRAKDHLRVIASEAQRLSRLIENVLCFARGQRKAHRLERRRHRLSESVERVLDQFAPLFDELGIRVCLEGDREQHAFFDRDAFEQILGNLLSNVEKYAADGGVLELRWKEKGETVSLVVADRGPGIPKAKREVVFLPFTRLSDSIREGASGTGIGLSLARDLARRQGGELRLVDSEQGARFELTLPSEEGSEG